MLNEIKIKDLNIEEFKSKILSFGKEFKKFAFLNSNDFVKSNTNFTYYEFDFLAAFSSYQDIHELDDLAELLNQKHGWLFGFFAYDLKNQLENLNSNNIDEINFPDLHFFSPEIVIYSKNSTIYINYNDEFISHKKVLNYIETIKKIDPNNKEKQPKEVQIKNRITKLEYINCVKKLKDHIQRGDIYEVNFCQEFFSNQEIDPFEAYQNLNSVSPTPFSCFYKFDDKYLISASPERFIKKNKNKIISQPIKGTIKRSADQIEDKNLKLRLLNDEKERAENVMIVDLVRNDLSKTAVKSSVKVEELFGIYSFTQVHQMISTIVSQVNNKTNIIDIIKYAFPMGSMTGAPKIRAMELIEQYEKTKRGLYSGSVGFISPENNFDFNVVIRSILYNESKKYVSFTVGGAITSLSDPEKEYEECMVKSEAMRKALSK